MLGKNRYVRLVYLLAMLVLGAFIINDYWTTDQFTAIKQFSFYGMSLVFAYILLHMGKRLLWKRLRVWDYLYYIALISLISPVLWGTSKYEVLFHWIVDVGVCFFVIPIVIDLYFWTIKFKKRNQ